MMHFTKGLTVDVIVTITERITLDNPFILFVFKNRETGARLTKIYPFSEDGSPFPGRYNEFALEVDSLFEDEQEGQWSYSVYEQESDTNTDESLAFALEAGLMQLHPAPEVITKPKKYNPASQQVKIYKGE
jgi:hypothetical protein